MSASVQYDAIIIGSGQAGTPLSATLAQARMRTVEAQTLLRRIGQPQDIAGIAVFLASEGSSWITGETFVISGGYR
jgi:3-oxoacyl-[acyl-carrier protein] reductase